MNAYRREIVEARRIARINRIIEYRPSTIEYQRSRVEYQPDRVEYQRSRVEYQPDRVEYRRSMVEYITRRLKKVRP